MVSLGSGGTWHCPECLRLAISAALTGTKWHWWSPLEQLIPSFQSLLLVLFAHTVPSCQVPAHPPCLLHVLLLTIMGIDLWNQHGGLDIFLGNLKQYDNDIISKGNIGLWLYGMIVVAYIQFHA